MNVISNLAITKASVPFKNLSRIWIDSIKSDNTTIKSLKIGYNYKDVIKNGKFTDEYIKINNNQQPGITGLPRILKIVYSDPYLMNKYIATYPLNNKTRKGLYTVEIPGKLSVGIQRYDIKQTLIQIKKYFSYETNRVIKIRLTLRINNNIDLTLYN